MGEKLFPGTPETESQDEFFSVREYGNFNMPIQKPVDYYDDYPTDKKSKLTFQNVKLKNLNSAALIKKELVIP